MKNIAIISLGSGGTMGHMTLTTKLADLLSKKGHKIFLISEADYSSFSNIENNKICLLKVKKQKHTKTVGGCLNYRYKRQLIEILRLKKIDAIIFSTFYDCELIKHAKKLGMKSYLVSYPLRDSHRAAIICRKYHSYFEKVFTLTDLFEIFHKYPNEIFVKPIFYKWQKTQESKKIKNILFTCGGGGRPSSKQFFRIINRVVPIIKKEYPHIKMTLIKGNSKFSSNEKNLKIIHWSNNFIKLLKGMDLVISEAGYYTILDLIRLNKPAIIIPGERRIDNQELRAVEFEIRGFGEFFLPIENPRFLFNKIKKLIENRKILADYASNYKKFKFRGEDIGKAISNELK